MFMTAKEASKKWGISDRRIRVLCAEGKISGAYQEGRVWKIPSNADKPADARFKSKESLIEKVEHKKSELDKCRPLTEGELERLNEEFTVEFTYNSNAIEGNTLTLRETDMVLRGLTIDQKPLKDHLEAIGHRDAFDYVSELVTTNTPISESVIKQIHFLVLADKKADRGIYRRVPVRIMGVQHTGHTCKRCRYRKCQQFEFRHIDTYGFCCNSIITNSHNRTTASGINQVQNNKQRKQNKYHTYGKVGVLRRSGDTKSTLYNNLTIRSHI